MKPKRARPKFDLSPLDFEETLNSPALTGIRECLESLSGKETVALSVTVPQTVPASPGGKLRRAVDARDGHSSGEEMLYQALWNHAEPDTGDTRTITVGWDRMSKLARLTPRNTKVNCQRLIAKLALEVIAAEDSFRRIGRTYRVFSPRLVVERRKAAGMEWVIKTRGVEFVPGP